MSQYTISLGGQTITVVSLPTSPERRAVQFDAADAVAIVNNPFTGMTQAQQWPGADLLSGTMTLPPLTQAQADDWISFLLQCRGMANAFLIGDPAQTAPRGSGSGAPFVDNSQNGGNPPGSQWLGTRGWTSNAQGVLKRGDWISVDWRLYRVLDDVNADGSGNALLPIWPSLREQPTQDGTSNLWQNATATVNGFHSAPVNPCVWGAQFGSFQLIQSLPDDAVVVSILPVILLGNTPAVISRAAYSLVPTVGPVWSYGHTYGFDFPTYSGSTTYPPGTQFYDTPGGGVVPTVASLANGWIGVSIESTTSATFTAQMTVQGAGFAIYYTSATPLVDTSMAAPVAVPAGQGLAWAMPLSSVVGDGNVTTGNATAAPAQDNGGLVLTKPKGLFRLANNKRSWAADVRRATDISFPIQEYR